MPSPHEIAFDLALRALTAQRARLDNIRTRAGTLLAAASLVTGFLGAEALKDTTIAKTGAQIADPTLQASEVVAILAFVVVALTCLWMLRPQGKVGWQFETSASGLVNDYVDPPDAATADEMHRNLALDFEDYYDHNEPRLGRLMWWFELGTAALLVEIVAWLLDLGLV